MNPNNSHNIDQILLRITQLYSEAKQGRIDQWEKDMLLDDIKNLYIYVKKELEVPDKMDFNLEIEEKIIESVVENMSTPDPEIENVTIEEAEEAEVEEVEEPKTEDLEDNDPFFNRIKEIQSKLRDEKQKIEHSIVENAKPIDTPEAIEPPLKMSSDSILKFLKKDENPEKDIYSFIDLNTRIGLVDKFFKGDITEFNSCLFFLSKAESIEESIDIIDGYAHKYDIHQSSEIYNTLTQIVDRKHRFMR
jgi:hypothetical protein